MRPDEGWVVDPDDEFLKPPSFGLEEPEEKPEEPAEEWDFSRGFRDGTGSVRIWTDEDGHLEKVWVSANWRKKVKGGPLAQAFLATFFTVNIVCLTGKHTLPFPEPLPAKPYDGPLSWDTLRRAQADHAAVDAKLAELDESLPPTRWVGDGAVGTDYDGAVKLYVGMFGNPAGVTFEEEWLDGPVRASEIANGVMTAYRDAMSRYVKPYVEFGERELLAREHDQITRSLLATAQNGIKP
ncbi:hypothetical protein HMPREF1531_00589 [Propionibacterium sp. oral taxon 192 str. F0372]|uniref:hypothetical protein n=1 Tax=Propionibacterium sp. oral taxon 192 TaxID=671222 RepID=UPI000353AF27|nr:hypothetical protein [Propionibacterium sp. oral taxon 192]EPH05941.1 hypothetical protein HMPREF1531_00589 [Propionibacterium sp. oral taxon 192 str. F0372]